MKVLIPTNMSKQSQAAADFALSYFGEDTEYCLLNSFPLIYKSGFYDSFFNYSPEHDEIPIEKLKRERRRLIKEFGAYKINTKASYGDPVKDIFRTAEDLSVDVIILGHNHYKNWEDGFLYRENHRLEELPFPILLVPDKFKVSGSASICYITDFTNQHAEKILSFLHILARSSKGNFKLFCLESGEKDESIENWVIDNYPIDANYSFVHINKENLEMTELIDSLHRNDNSLVIFDSEMMNNELLVKAKSLVSLNCDAKPLLLIPPSYKTRLPSGV